MKKLYIYIIGAMALAACSDNINYDMPDNVTDQVQFTVGNVLAGETLTSRAEHTHAVTYDPKFHPNKLGVFASYGSTITPVETAQKEGSTTVWKSDLYWPEISDQESVDFIGYMVDGSLPEEGPDGPKVTKDGSTYTLTFPATIAAPVLFDDGEEKVEDKAPLVCCEPINVETKVAQVKFDMDRTLAGYSVWFQLGDKMDKVRDFKVKAVNVTGNTYTSGDVECAYTCTWDGEHRRWEKQISWKGLQSSTAFDVDLSWSGMPTGGLLVGNNSSDYVKWGESEVSSQAFFAIPNENFTPTIKVTYDVVLNEPDNGIITRKDVVSTIALDRYNFTGPTIGQPGKVHPIKIKIVPSYLYVLADKDQTTTGFLIVDQ